MESLQFSILFQTSRSIAVELRDAGIYYTEQPYEIWLDGERAAGSDKVIQTLRGLLPDTEYTLQLRMGDRVSAPVTARTNPEFVTLDVRRFGAVGDGAHDDTPAIQAAIAACPREGRVLVPPGVYRVSCLFLKSDLFLDIAEGATLSAFTARERFPVLPGLIESVDETAAYNLASWEGNPVDCYASILTGIHVENVVISGGGVLDGNAGFDNWWAEAGGAAAPAFRPRMVFLNRCNNVVVHDLTVQNSPAWNLHPYFSDNTRWLDLRVQNPKDSPNTDGIDPESCNGIEIAGVYFSLGDDCIAVKSGKYYMGSTYKTPSQNLEIRQCRMCNGHGAVTIGSEMAAGVKNLLVRDCRFENTDRGLRVKTRRGRGKDAVVDNVRFTNIKMDGVLTPFVVNSFYWCCDPDGKSEYVRCKDPLPVDDRTPAIRRLEFRDIEARNCHVAASFLYGLPERRIEEVVFENITVDFAADPTPEYPAMMADVEPCTRKGVYINNVERLVLRNVRVTGHEGEAFDLHNIGEVVTGE